MDKQVQAVIFDMDGVIFDSERLVIECWQVIAENITFRILWKSVCGFRAITGRKRGNGSGKNTGMIFRMIPIKRK